MDKVIAQDTGKFTYTEGGVTYTAKWDAQLVHREGNELPYFSLTGTIYEGTRCVEKYAINSGAIGDRLAEIDERFDVVNRLHLSDSKGVPMHAVANGYYFLGFTEWEDFNRPVVANHFRITEDEAQGLHDEIAALPESERRAAVEAFCEAQRPRWQAEADEALQAIVTGR